MALIRPIPTGTSIKGALWGDFQAINSTSSLAEYDFTNDAYTGHGGSGTITGPHFKTVTSASGTVLAVYAVHAGTYGYTIGTVSEGTTYTENSYSADDLIWSTTVTTEFRPLFICK